MSYINIMACCPGVRIYRTMQRFRAGVKKCCKNAFKNIKLVYFDFDPNIQKQFLETIFRLKKNKES